MKILMPLEEMEQCLQRVHIKFYLLFLVIKLNKMKTAKGVYSLLLEADVAASLLSNMRQLVAKYFPFPWANAVASPLYQVYTFLHFSKTTGTSLQQTNYL